MICVCRDIAGHGDCGPCLEGVARLREALRGDILRLGRLVVMVPDLEALGIRMLLNECVAMDRGRAYTSPGSTTHISIAQTTSKKRRRGFHSKFIGRPPTPFRPDAERTSHGGQISSGCIPICRSRSAPRSALAHATCGHGRYSGTILRRSCASTSPGVPCASLCAMGSRRLSARPR